MAYTTVRHHLGFEIQVDDATGKFGFHEPNGARVWRSSLKAILAMIEACQPDGEDVDVLSVSDWGTHRYKIARWVTKPSRSKYPERYWINSKGIPITQTNGRLTPYDAKVEARVEELKAAVGEARRALNDYIAGLPYIEPGEAGKPVVREAHDAGF